jgi:putative glutathione S-transferase
MLVDGKWAEKWRPEQAKDEKGGFVRQESRFRNWITADGSPGPAGEGGFPAEAGRYHLYVSLGCPWASRTLIVRKLKGLEDAISVLVVEPFLTDEGWRFGDFPGADRDTLNGATYLHEVYTKANPHYTGRVTVPVLWDKERQTIVNNESSEIIRMLNGAFGKFARKGIENRIDLYPPEFAAEIDALNEPIYRKLNNGVYRTGFATTQEAYEDGFRDVFEMLDELEQRLAGRTFLVGERLTETDVRTFVTLVRFDNAYHGVFKCNRQRIADYPNLTAYLKRILAIPGVRETVSIEHIKKGYYSIKALNPNGIVPLGPLPALP